MDCVAQRSSFGGRLGFGSSEPEHPVALAEVSLPAPRLRPPEAFAVICATDEFERAPAPV